MNRPKALAPSSYGTHSYGTIPPLESTIDWALITLIISSHAFAAFLGFLLARYK